MKFSFVIKAPFNPVSITPAAGTVETLPLTIAVDFGEKVGYVDEAASVKLLKDGNDYLIAKAVKASDTKVNLKYRALQVLSQRRVLINLLFLLM